MKTQRWILLMIAIGAVLILGGCDGGKTGGISSIKANADTDQTVHVGSRVQLNARKSVTEDNWVYHFKWSVISKPPGSTMALTSTTSTGPSFTVDKVGEYLFELNVTVDGIGSDTDQVKVSATNAAPVANGFGLIVDVNQSSVGLNWRSASSVADADSDSLSVTIASNGAYGTCILVGNKLTYQKTTETKQVDHCTLAVSDGYAMTNVVVDIESLYWTKIAAGENYTFAIKSNGTLWAWGRNYDHRLGDGTFVIQRESPVQIGSEIEWKAISAGKFHVVALKNNGDLWAWGNNYFGQLGDRSRTNAPTPKQIASGSIWLEVNAGGSHTVGIKSDGTLWTWGHNNNGQRGDGTHDNSSTPEQILLGTTWSHISAGGSHTVAIKSDGTLWAWGKNFSGQLGDGTNNGSDTPKQILLGTTWSHISAGSSHTVAIKSDGTLWAWGKNFSGQLGDGSNDNKNIPVQIAPGTTWSYIYAGDDHTTAIKSDGTLWAWGKNDEGMLGDGTTVDKNIPVQEHSHSSDWISVVAGSAHTVAIQSDGRYWVWGKNGFGQFGNGMFDNKLSPVQKGANFTWSKVEVGHTHAVALRSDKTIWSWGQNVFGQLGDGTQESSLFLVQESTHSSSWIDVSTKLNHTAAIREDGKLYLWGKNSHGQLGNNSVVDSTSPSWEEKHKAWIKVSAGHEHTLAIDTDNKLWSWGNNVYGDLCIGNIDQKLVPQKVNASETWRTVSAGNNFSAAIKSDKTIWTCGKNDHGQLGDGSSSSRYNLVNENSSSTWTSASAGNEHTVAIKVAKTLYGWGNGVTGALGDGDGSWHDRTSPTQEDSLGNEWHIAVAGKQYTLAIKIDGSLWAWGANSYGQLGDSSLERKISPVRIGTDTDWSYISASDNHSVGIKTDGSLWEWGKTGIPVVHPRLGIARH